MVAQALLERDTLSRVEFEAAMNGEPLPAMSEVEKLKPSCDIFEDETTDKEEAEDDDATIRIQEESHEESMEEASETTEMQVSDEEPTASTKEEE